MCSYRGGAGGWEVDRGNNLALESQIRTPVMNKEQIEAVWAFVSLLAIEHNQLSLKINAAEEALKQHPEMEAEYRSKWLPLQTHPVASTTQLALANPRRSLFPDD